MAIVAEAQQDQIEAGWIAWTQRLEQGRVGRGAGLRIGQLGGHRMEAGPAARFTGQQRFREHAGVAGGILPAHPALITQQHIDSLPRQVLLSQQAVGRLRGLATGQRDLGAVPFGQGEVDHGSDLLGALAGKVVGAGGHRDPVGGHDSHSVWKLPGRSVRS